MAKWLNKIVPKTGFARNVMTLMTGTVISQVIAVLTTPVISRLYSTADYGVFTTCLAIVSVAGIFVSARYEQLIVIVKTKRDAINILALSLFTVLVVSLLLFIAVLTLPRLFDIEKLLDAKGLSSWLIYLPLSILLLGTYQVFEWYGIRRKDYKKMRKAPVAQNFTKVSVNIGLGLQSVLQGGLILGYIAGQTAGVWVLLAGRLRSLRRSFLIHFSYKHCIGLAQTGIKTALTLVSTGLIASLANYMPVFLLGYFFGAHIVGVYSMSFAIVNLPTLVIGKALADVAYKHTMDIINSNNSLAEYIERIVARLLLLAVVPAVLLALFAQPLFVFLLGDEWQLTGVFIQILLPYFLFRFISSPATLFLQTGNSRLLLYWEVLFLCLTALSLVLGKIIFNSYMASMSLLSATNTVCYFLMLYLNFRISGAKWRNVPLEIKKVIVKYRKHVQSFVIMLLCFDVL